MGRTLFFYKNTIYARVSYRRLCGNNLKSKLKVCQRRNVFRGDWKPTLFTRGRKLNVQKKKRSIIRHQVGFVIFDKTKTKEDLTFFVRGTRRVRNASLVFTKLFSPALRIDIVLVASLAAVWHALCLFPGRSVGFRRPITPDHGCCEASANCCRAKSAAVPTSRNRSSALLHLLTGPRRTRTP